MNQPKKKAKPGPAEDRIKIEGDWKDAMKQALQKPRPAEGWPKPEPKKRTKTRPAE